MARPDIGLDALPSADAFEERVRATLAELASEVERRDEWVEVRLAPGQVQTAAKTIRDSGLDMNLLVYVTGVDRPDETQVELLYHLYSTVHPESIMLRTAVPYDAATLPSVTPVWPAASWHERETADMFDVSFEGHPYPRRLLLDDDEPSGCLRKHFELREPVDVRQRFAERFVDGERMPFRHRPVRADATMPGDPDESS